MIFLGTSASEMIPNPMCGCDVCKQALASKDPREKRCRSAFLLDEENLIDCGPDVLSACGREGVSLQNLKHIFLTHTHTDHFSSTTLKNLQMCITEAPRIKIFMSQAAYDGMIRLGNVMLEQDYVDFSEQAKRWPTRCTFVPVEPFKDYQVDDMVVSAVVGRHPGRFVGENSLNYLFRKDGKTLFYACDTGLFFPETFEYLKDFRLDTLIIENAFGKQKQPRETFKHMTTEFLFETLDQLIAQGTVDSNTKIYVTHIGHKNGHLHGELNQLLQGRYGDQICVAYDGLRI